LPVIPFTSSFGLRIDDILILGFFPFLFLYRPQIHRSLILNTYLLSLILIIISAFYGYLILCVPFSVRDVNEVARLSKPVILIFLALQANSDYILQKIEKIIPWLTVIICIVAFIQYFNIAGMGRIIASVYAPEHHVSALLTSSSRRVMITGSDPNTGAAIAVFFWLYNFFSFMSKRKRMLLFNVLLLTIVILMTSSRTSFLGLVGIIGFFMVFSSDAKMIYKILTVGMIIGLLIIFYDKFQYLAVGLAQFFRGENNSFQIRINIWKESFDLFKQSYVFGWGPAKGIMTTIVDGEYFLLLRRFGIIGTFGILFSIFYLPFVVKNRQKILFPVNVKIMDNVLKYYLIEIACVMLTNSFFTSYQLLLPFVFSCVVMYKEKKKNLSKHSYPSLEFA
jgi:O-antigen ligase